MLIVQITHIVTIMICIAIHLSLDVKLINTWTQSADSNDSDSDDPSRSNDPDSGNNDDSSEKRLKAL